MRVLVQRVADLLELRTRLLAGAGVVGVEAGDLRVESALWVRRGGRLRGANERRGNEEEVEERSPQKEMKKKSRRRKVKKEKRRVKNDKKRGKNVDDIDNIDQFVFEENDIVVPVVEPELSGNWRTQLLETKNAKENKKSKVQFFYIDESDSLASASSFLVDDDFLSACQPMNCFANE